MSQTFKLLVIAAVSGTLASLAYLAAPALTLQPYIPKPREFSLTDPQLQRILKSPSAQTAWRRGGKPRVGTYTSKPLTAPERFNIVGITWRGDVAPKVWIRARKKSGRWSSWTQVPNAEDEGPDRSSAEGSDSQEGTVPVWAGFADVVQYRLRGPVAAARGLRLRFVNSTGTATPADRVRNTIRRHVNAAVAALASPWRNASAYAQAEPAIIDRSEWGGDENCKPRTTPSTGDVKLAVIHHTVSLNDYSADESASIVLGICRYHRNTRGWNDIGYNFLVDKYGQIFEGRDGGVDQAIVGAHAQGYNSTSTGIGNIGDFSSVDQTAAGVDAVERLLAWKLALHGVPATGTVTVTSGGGTENLYPSGEQVTLHRISGHRDANSTDCPGDSLYGQLPSIRTGTEQYMLSGSTTAASVSLSASPSKITYKSKSTLTGQTLAPDGSALADQPVHMQVARQHRWQDLKILTTDAAGSFTTTVRPPRLRSYRARFPGSQTAGTAKSKRVQVSVRPKLTLRMTADQTERGTYLVKKGSLTHARGKIGPRRRQVVLIVKRRGASRTFIRTLRRAVLAKRGIYRAGLRLSRSGRYRIRAHFKGDKTHTRSRSPDVEVLVR